MKKLNNLIYIILIIIFLIIFIKLNYNAKLQIKNISHNNTFEYMYNLNIHNYNTEGILVNAIKANYWQFFPKQNLSIIKQPNLIIYKALGETYSITANAANIIHEESNKIKFIKFFDQININKNHIKSFNSSFNSGFNLKTSYLEFNPNTDLASTNKDVIITKIGLIMTGTGMDANLKTNQLELHKNVLIKYLNNLKLNAK